MSLKTLICFCFRENMGDFAYKETVALIPAYNRDKETIGDTFSSQAWKNSNVNLFPKRNTELEAYKHATKKHLKIWYHFHSESES